MVKILSSAVILCFSSLVIISGIVTSENQSITSEIYSYPYFLKTL